MHTTESPCVTNDLSLERSAHPDRVKRWTAVCVGLRILMNTSTSLGWEFRSEELTELAVRMKDSGYNERLRGEVIRDATIGWERKVQAAEAGQRPTYRPREWEQKEKQRQKLIKKSAWYRPQADVASFYPATRNSELIKRIRKVIEEEASRLDMKVWVVEKGGESLKTKLVKSEIRQNSECVAPDSNLDVGGRRIPSPCRGTIRSNVRTL